CGTTVYLQVSVGELCKRLQVCKHARPVLNGLSGESLQAFVSENLKKRDPYYTQASILFDAEKMLTDADIHDISTALEKIL
ncbi:MAG: shikimate kinase, partial [Synergistaceae bacterium]